VQQCAVQEGRQMAHIINPGSWDHSGRLRHIQQEDDLVQQQLEAACGVMRMQWGTTCQGHNHKSALHGKNNTIFVCRHVVTQDEDHPIGIVHMPAGYYLCKKCYDYSKLRKFDFMHELTTECWQCVLAEVNRIVELDPSKFTDLFTKKP
jgi:hypothetical protein